jgi:hypothetical protein
MRKQTTVLWGYKVVKYECKTETLLVFGFNASYLKLASYIHKRDFQEKSVIGKEYFFIFFSKRKKATQVNRFFDKHFLIPIISELPA